MADRFVIVFSRKVSDTPVVVKRKKVRPEQIKDGISFKGRTHIIDLSKPMWREKSKFIYLVDVDSGQKTVMDVNYPVSPKLLDAVLRKEIAKQLVSGLGGQDWGMTIILVLVASIGALCAGIVLGQFIDFPTGA